MVVCITRGATKKTPEKCVWKKESKNWSYVNRHFAN